MQIFKCFNSPHEEKPKTEFDIILEEFPKWAFCRVLPIIYFAIIIDILIIFLTPRKIAMYDLFWLREPLSIAVAYFVVKILRKLFVR